MKKFILLAGLLVVLGVPFFAKAATITVNTTEGDMNIDGNCSFSEALSAANGNFAIDTCTAGDPGMDTINFAIPAADPGCDGNGVCTIGLTSPIPGPNEPVTIDGTTQNDGAGHTVSCGTSAGAADRDLKIVIDATAINATGSPLPISTGSDGSIIKGLDIVGAGTGGGGAGFVISDTGSLTLTCNNVGTDNTGLAIAGHANSQNGILIFGGTGGITIGGSTYAESNIISGNGNNGIFLVDSPDNIITGNYVGVAGDGTAALANGTTGITILDTGGGLATGNQVGGAAAGEGNFIEKNSGTGLGIGAPSTSVVGNVISGNGDNGMTIVTNDNVVQKNFIGVGADGTTLLPNTNNGIVIAPQPNPPDGNLIGGNSTLGEANVISGNGAVGIVVFGTTNTKIEGNLIGTTASGNTAVGNIGGAIFDQSNTGLEIGGDGTAGQGNVISANDGMAAILCFTSDGTTVTGNLIGFGANGTTHLGNLHSGILIFGSTNIVIGEPGVGQGNFFGNNGAGATPGDPSSGLLMAGTDATVQNNYFGLDVTGAPAGNFFAGIGLLSSSGSIIGGDSTAGEGNVISANQYGIVLANTDDPGISPASSDNKIFGNYIGTDKDGNVSVGYGNTDGIAVASDSHDNQIGGTGTGEGNIIAGNSDIGVAIANETAVIGGQTYNDPIHNSIISNSIHDNGNLGIDLLTDTNNDPSVFEEGVGVTPNDPLDPDSGPNNYLNHPVITRVTDAGLGNVNVNYFLDVPAGNYRVEFFDNTAADSSGFGEGQTFVGSQNVSSTGTGNQMFTALVTGTTSSIITATVTEDLGGGNFGDSSEFSNASSLGVDFGDAPDIGSGTFTGNYNTLATDNGPYHIMDGTLYLGSCEDGDNGDLQNSNATADDTNISGTVVGTCATPGDDEDGVTFNTSFRGGILAKMTVRSSGSGKLDVWVDWNQDGDFLDADEHLVTDQSVSAGSTTETFTVPITATPGRTFMRFRLTPNGIASPTGEVIGGEVEDYQINVLSNGGETTSSSNGVGAGGDFPAHQDCTTVDCLNNSGSTTTTSPGSTQTLPSTGGTPSTTGTSPGTSPFSNLSCPEFIFSRLSGTALLPSQFADANPNHQAYPYLIDLAKKGIVDGRDKTNAALDQPIQRSEMAKIFSYAREDKLKLGDCLKALGEFPDVKQGSWYYNSVMNLKDKKIVQGYPDGLYRPDQATNYAELLKVTALSFGFANKADVDNLEATIGKKWFVSYKEALDKQNLIPSWLQNTPFEQLMTRGDAFAMLSKALAKHESSKP